MSKYACAGVAIIFAIIMLNIGLMLGNGIIQYPANPWADALAYVAAVFFVGIAGLMIMEPY